MKAYGLIRILKIIAATSLVAAATSASAVEHRSYSGWLSFQYPDGWHVIETEQTRTRYVENVAVQPRGQDFTGRNGQIILRVFDPFYVIEESGLSANADGQQIFRTFVRGLPEESSASIATESIRGTTLWVARSRSADVTTFYLGGRTSGGYLVVVGGATGPEGDARLEQRVSDVFFTLRFGQPSGINTNASEAVARFYAAVGRGDSESVARYSCANARLLQGLVGLFAQASGLEGINEAIVRAGSDFDYSGLRYMTVVSSADMAAVRVGGTVRRPDGGFVSFPKYAQAFGSNVLIVRREGSSWKVCEPMRRSR